LPRDQCWRPCRAEGVRKGKSGERRQEARRWSLVRTPRRATLDVLSDYHVSQHPRLRSSPSRGEVYVHTCQEAGCVSTRQRRQPAAGDWTLAAIGRRFLDWRSCDPRVGIAVGKVGVLQSRPWRSSRPPRSSEKASAQGAAAAALQARVLPAQPHCVAPSNQRAQVPHLSGAGMQPRWPKCCTPRAETCSLSDPAARVYLCRVLCGCGRRLAGVVLPTGG